MVGAAQLALTEYTNDAELTAACRRRDLRAFEQLYLSHASRLKSIAFHMVGNRQDAEDAVQETFVKAYRAIDGFAGRSSLVTWLSRVLINVCYDVTRKRKREPDEEPPEMSGPRNQLPLRAALDEALGRINPRQRMVFMLFEVEGFKHSEIAGILEIPEGTSKAWLFEAKKELKRLLMEAPK